MGLLEWGKFSPDPDKNASINQGLLAMGLSLLNSRGSFGNALGQAGLDGMGVQRDAYVGSQNDRLRTLQRGQIEAQMAAQKKAAEQAAIDEDAFRKQFMPTAPLDALSGGGGPTRANADRIGQMPQFDPRGMVAQGASPEAVVRAMQFQSALNPAPKYMNVAPGATVLDERTGRPVFSAPQKEREPSSLSQLITEMNALPPGDPRRGMYINAINKAVTHAPPSQQINYGTPMPAVNPKTGKTELVRPDNKGGMTFTGVEPPPQNRDVKQPAEIQRMNIAADTMDQLLNQYEALLKTNNPRDPLVQMNPTARANFQSLMKNIQLQFKELQALGALAGPDLTIMEAAITDPFTVKGAFYGQDGLMAQIGQARNLIRLRRQAIGSQGGPADAPSGAATPGAVIDFGSLK